MAFTAMCPKIDTDSMDLGLAEAMKKANIPEPIQLWVKRLRRSWDALR